MEPSTLREIVRNRLTEFAWDQWAQMGILASTSRVDTTAADPESLLLLSFEVGRTDPRLFDEVLDWLTVNGDLVSRRRLRNLCVDDRERSLADAGLAWAGEYQSALRTKRPQPASRRRGEPLTPVFRNARRTTRLDPAFAAYGWAKPRTEPTRKSTRPQLVRPINFTFRLRELFGVGSRAEVIRFLLTSRVQGAQAQAVTAAAGFAKRNVVETLNALTAAGVVTSYGVGNEHRYLADLPTWEGFFSGSIPSHRDWPQLLRALRIAYRWLEEEDLESLSTYMRASQARRLIDHVRSDLLFAGIRVGDDAVGEAYWAQFTETIRVAVEDGLRP